MSLELTAPEPDKTKGNFTAPVTFTLAELWLLNDVVRHELAQLDAWKYPPVSKQLNQEIALALVACVDSKLDEYTLELSEGDMLVIDFNVRRDMKDAKGQAFGYDILIKCFRALARLAGLTPSQACHDFSYKEVTTHADPSTG